MKICYLKEDTKGKMDMFDVFLLSISLSLSQGAATWLVAQETGSGGGELS